MDNETSVRVRKKKNPFRKISRWLQRFEGPEKRQARVRQTLAELSARRLMPKSHVDYLRGLQSEHGFNPEVVFDVGACVLHWTTEASLIWPNAKFVVFEAMEAGEFLYRERGLDYHLSVLSDQDGREVSFFQNDLHPGGNSYYQENEVFSPPAKRIYGEANKVTKIARTLDAVVRERGFPQPQLIKIDVQGAEFDVLHGAQETLAGCQHLILELQKVQYNKGAPLRETVIDYVCQNGFDLVTPLFSDNGPDGDYHFARRKT